MQRHGGKRRAPDKVTWFWVSVSLIALFLVVSGEVAEASWHPFEERGHVLAAASSPVSNLIKQAVGQSVSLLMLAVAIIIAVPVVIAGLAFSVSFLLSRAVRRSERRHVPAAAFPRLS